MLSVSLHYNILYIGYVLRARDILDFMNPRASAFVLMARGFMKSSISRVYGVHNMFSAYHGTDSVPLRVFCIQGTNFKNLRGSFAAFVHTKMEVVWKRLVFLHTNGDCSPTRTHRSLNRMFSPC